MFTNLKPVKIERAPSGRASGMKTEPGSGLTMTATGAVDKQGTDRARATVSWKTKGRKCIRRKRGKRKDKSVGLREGL